MYFSRDSRVRRPSSRCACVFLAKTSRYIVRNNRPESPRGRRESCRAPGPRYSAVIGAKRSGRLLTRARRRLWLSGLGGTAGESSSPRVSVTRWEKESSLPQFYAVEPPCYF